MSHIREIQGLENVFDIYEVKIHRGITTVDTNPIRLFNVEGYTVDDIGKAVNRIQKINSNIVFFHEQEYKTGFITITFNAICWDTDFSDLYTLHKKAISSDTLNDRFCKIYDIYGHTYDCALITQLKWTSAAFNARDAVNLSIEIVVIPSAINNVFRPLKAGESIDNVPIPYIMESCTIKPRISQPIQLGGDMQKIVVPSVYTSDLFDMTISGIELYGSLFDGGGFTKSFYKKGTVNLGSLGFGPSQLKSIATSIDILPMQGSTCFQNFNVSLIAGDAACFIGDDEEVNLIESWSLTDISGRSSYSKTLNGFVYQKYASINYWYEINVSLLVTDYNKYPHGELISGGLSLPGFAAINNVLVLDRSVAPMEGTKGIKKLSLRCIGNKL
jgi:hypothetical protein